jgi:hypothetical protein
MKRTVTSGVNFPNWCFKTLHTSKTGEAKKGYYTTTPPHPTNDCGVTQ